MHRRTRFSREPPGGTPPCCPSDLSPSTPIQTSELCKSRDLGLYGLRPLVMWSFVVATTGNMTFSQ